MGMCVYVRGGLESRKGEGILIGQQIVAAPCPVAGRESLRGESGGPVRRTEERAA